MSLIFTGSFPAKRMRRMRRDDFSRRLMREHVLTADDLIYPVFVIDGDGRREPVASHARRRAHVDRRAAARSPSAALKLRIPALALFPVDRARAEVADGARSVGTPKAWCRARCAR